MFATWGSSPSSSSTVKSRYVSPSNRFESRWPSTPPKLRSFDEGDNNDELSSQQYFYVDESHIEYDNEASQNTGYHIPKNFPAKMYYVVQTMSPDIAYGPKYDERSLNWYMGKTPIYFCEKTSDIFIGNEHVKGSKGLYELILSRNLLD
ncbi:hypothetical protein HHI36_001486 [Cryptolaemus montrouzieri]|uniref:DUF8207 domain-containing protein n=1 Tax=Cryptolaemus montrouzieri TaxID=559131 RepID=A0ABD2P932_9CUCU